MICIGYPISCDMIPGESFGTITRTDEGTSTTNTQQKPQQQQCRFGQPCCATTAAPYRARRHERCAVLPARASMFVSSETCIYLSPQHRGRQAIPRSNSSWVATYYVGKNKTFSYSSIHKRGVLEDSCGRDPKLEASLASLSSLCCTQPSLFALLCSTYVL